MRAILLGVMTAALILGGCKKAAVADNEISEEDAPARHGRFAGIGVYAADQGWAHLADVAAPASKARATIRDDSMVIVTVDGATGEIRQCGNYSGHCVALDAWHGRLGPKQQVPVSLDARPDASGNEVAIAHDIDLNATDGTEAAPAKK